MLEYEQKHWFDVPCGYYGNCTFDFNWPDDYVNKTEFWQLQNGLGDDYYYTYDRIEVYERVYKDMLPCYYDYSCPEGYKRDAPLDKDEFWREFLGLEDQVDDVRFSEGGIENFEQKYANEIPCEYYDNCIKIDPYKQFNMLSKKSVAKHAQYQANSPSIESINMI